MKRVFLLPFVFACLGQAQIETCEGFKAHIDRIVSAGAGDDVSEHVLALADIGATTRCYLLYFNGTLLGNAFQQFVQRFEGLRTDKQAGASVAGAGSTSAVAQGAIAKSFSVAAEYGALTQSVNGQVVTLQGNLGGIPTALVRNDLFPYCVGDETTGPCVRPTALSLLRRLSFTASFDTSRDVQTLTGTAVAAAPAGGSTASTPVTFTGRKRELTAFSSRLELWNTRDATSKKFMDAWKGKVGPALDTATGELLVAGIAVTAVKDAAWYPAWRAASLVDLRAAGRDRVLLVAALNKVLKDFAEKAKGDLSLSIVTSALAAYNRYFLAQDELIDTLSKTSVVAIEYSDSRPLGKVPVNNIRLILDAPLGAKAKVVANAAVDFYGRVPQTPGADLSRFRDMQIGLQLDCGLFGGTSIAGPAVLSLAGYYQYQHSAVLLNVDGANPLPGITFTGLPDNTTTVFAKTGNIWLAQAKVTVNPGGKSMKIPISVTYSNKTELIAKPTFRAQVGIAYDFDSLMSLVSSKK